MIRVSYHVRPNQESGIYEACGFSSVNEGKPLPAVGEGVHVQSLNDTLTVEGRSLNYDSGGFHASVEVLIYCTRNNPYTPQRHGAKAPAPPAEVNYALLAV